MTNVATARTAAFDFAFNGINEAQVTDIATADFVGRGENLLLVGGNATGKTTIAIDVLNAARANGKTSHHLGCPNFMYGQHELLHSSAGYIGFDGRSGVREELLNCDVLVIDEAYKWLASAPVLLPFLLGRRIELGKSTVLIFSTAEWHHALKMSFGIKRAWPESAIHQSVSENPDNHAWASFMFFGGAERMWQMLEAMGMNVNDERMAGEELARAYPIRYTAAKGIWHQVYCGEKSYREFLYGQR